MGKLIKCHFYYILNKLTIVILILVILSVIFFSFFTALSFDERTAFYLTQVDYYLSVYEVIKLIMFILIILLFGYSFSSVNDGYYVVVIGKDISRTKYLITKIFLLNSIFTFIYLIVVASTIIIGLSFNIVLNKEMLISFINLYILLMFYGELSIILVLLFDNIYAVFLLIPLSLISYDKTIYFLSFFLPIEEKQNVSRTFVLPLWYYIFEYLIIHLVINLLFNKKDLPH